MKTDANPLTEDLDFVLAHTGDVWNELRDSRVFITGGTGFFGCWILESFLWANRKFSLNAQAVVLTRNPEAFCRKYPHLGQHERVVLHRGDVRTFEFPEGKFSCVIHAAADVNVKRLDESPQANLETMIQGTRRTLDFAVQGAAKKFLYISSGAVYGKQPTELRCIPEDYTGAPAVTDPRSAYAEGKRVGELLSSIYYHKHGLHTRIARCFAFLGPYMPLDQSYAAENFIRDLIDGRDISVAGDGTPVRSYLYAADLMIWLWTILFKGVPARPYNVGSPHEITISELAHTIAACGTPPCTVHIKGNPILNVSQQRYVPSVKRAESELDCRCNTDLLAAIQKTIAWRRWRNSGVVP